MDEGKKSVNKYAQPLHEIKRIAIHYFYEMLALNFDPMDILKSASRYKNQNIYKPLDECTTDDEKKLYFEILNAEKSRKSCLQTINEEYIKIKYHNSVVDIRYGEHDGKFGLIGSWVDLKDSKFVNGELHYDGEFEPIECFINEDFIQGLYKEANMVMRGEELPKPLYLGTEYKEPNRV